MLTMCRLSPGPERIASTAACEPQITPIRFDVALKAHVVVRLLPRLHGAHHPGVVHPDLERAALAGRTGGRAVGVGVAHVELHREAADLVRRGGGRLGVHVRGEHGVAASRQAARDLAAEAAPRTGHDRDPRHQAAERTKVGWPASTLPRMAIAEVNGQQLYYEIHGEGEPLLCVHGLSLRHARVATPAPRLLGRVPHRDLRQPRRRPVLDGRRPTTRSPTWRATRSRSPTSSSSTASTCSASRWVARSRRRSRSRRPSACARSRSPSPSRPAAPTPQRLAEVWGTRVMQISREQHIDELMLLNHSEEFYESPETVRVAARR